MRWCAVLLFVSCSCKSPSTVVDAGTPVERGTDLRNALTTLFPEYRGVNHVIGRAAVTRESAPATQADLAKALEQAKQSGFSGEPPARAPFVMTQVLDGGTLTQEISLPLANDELGRVLAAPASMTTEAIAHWLPKVAPKTHEQFDFELVWFARDEQRASFLLWQLMDGALAQGWKADSLPSGWETARVDGGPVQLPTEFSVVLRNPHVGAAIDVERRAARAKLRYRLVTFERR